jgi:signal transduction histidine kinase
VHLQQVLLNLLLNGMDAMAQTPETARRLTLRTSRNGGSTIHISVSDRGHGISDEVLPHIFRSFITTKKESMGLGLSIARSIVETHGGRICGENDPGGGAVFRIELPALSSLTEQPASPGNHGAHRRHLSHYH